MVAKIILKWAKRLGAALKWLVDVIKALKLIWVLVFGAIGFMGHSLMEVQSQVRDILDSNPKYITEVVKEINTVEKPTFTTKIVEKCQCPSVSECQNIVTQAIEKNNRKHHPGFQ